MSDRWIVIPKWDRFQHYKDRQPPWIKNYTELMSDDAYRSLPLGTRGILHGIWMEYARGRRLLRGDSLSVSRALGQRVLTAQLDSLAQAGFIQLVASKPDASDTRVGEEEEKERREENTPLNPPSKQIRKPDELWDTLVDELGEPATRTERGKRNDAVKQLRDAGATPGEVRLRMARYRRRWPQVELTDQALVKHWTVMGREEPAANGPGPRRYGRGLTTDTMLELTKEAAHEDR